MSFLAARLVGARGWRRTAVAFLLGAVLTLGLAPVNLTLFLAVAFTGLVWLLDGAGSWVRAGWIGWWFGLGHLTTGLYWISGALLVEPAQFAWLLPFAVVGLPAVLSFFVAGATIAAHVLWSPGPFRVLALALAWTAGEWARGHWLTGFPWNLIGYTWSWSDPMMQLTAVTGIYGLSLLTVFVAAAPAALAANPSSSALVTLPRQWSMVIIATILIVGTWIGGAVRLAGADTGTVPGVVLRLVQANIPQSQKWQSDQRRENLNRHIQLTQQPSELGTITHAIWPETAAQYFLEFDPVAADLIGGALAPGGVVITGAIRATTITSDLGVTETQIWNSVQALDANGTIIAQYDKSHLVPFGEYVPFRKLLAAIGLEKITRGSLDYSQGPGPRTIEIIGAPTVSLLVCYEAIFPGQVVDKSDRPGWILNVTNDAWYGRSAGPYQHFAMVKTRAVELGLPLVRAGNSGISGVIGAHGQVVAKLGLGKTGVVDARLPVAIKPTLYAQFGDGILLIFFLILGGWLIGRRMKTNYA
jgi:apolipoprotein N-acyltransferase